MSDHTQISVRSVMRKKLVAVQFDDGLRMALGGPGLIGRNPAGRDGELFEHLIAVADDTRTISKTHLEFGLEPQGLWIIDRNSTNGSSVVLPDGQRVDLEPGVRVSAPIGSTVEIGDRHFQVEQN